MRYRPWCIPVVSFLGIDWQSVMLEPLSNVLLLFGRDISSSHNDPCPVDSSLNLLSVLDSGEGDMGLRTWGLCWQTIILVDNGSRNHVLQQFLIHTRAHTTIYATQFLKSCKFPKVASPSQCASLWRDMLLCVACTCSLTLLTKVLDISGRQYTVTPCFSNR